MPESRLAPTARVVSIRFIVSSPEWRGKARALLPGAAFQALAPQTRWIVARGGYTHVNGGGMAVFRRGDGDRRDVSAALGFIPRHIKKICADFGDEGGDFFRELG